MWIKTQDGNYYNMTYCREIFSDDNDCTHFRFDDCDICVPGDCRYVVIKNIISGTQLLEV